MTESPFESIIDNNAEILEDQKEGSVRDVLEYYIKNVVENKEDDDFHFRMDIGTGYLFFSGFRETSDLLQELVDENLLHHVNEENWDSEAPIRVVMGPETSGMTKEILTSLIKDGISQYQDSVVELLKGLVENHLIEFRVFLNRKFHAKIYNFYQRSKIPDDIWAGSANFSRGGLSNNIELSVPMHATSETRELFRTWFDELWKQSTKDLDVLKIIDEVEEPDFLKYHPRIFFSKLIKLLSKDYLLQEEKTWTDNILLDFQNLSYYIVMERLQKYGGYILANSVGLGKSYVACQAIRSYQRQNPDPDKKCLIIYPPRVKTEWETYVKEEFEISDSVDMISMGKLQKTPYEDREDDYYFDHRDFAEDYSLIVVDEIHHYRNPSNRTKNLKNIIGSNPQADSLFLSATPVNLGSEDLFNIIDLFYRGENVRKFENQGLRGLYDQTRQDVKKISRGESENLNREILSRVKEIEKELTLKISWRIVQEHFEEDLRELSGKKVKYEEPDTEEISFTYPDEYKKKIFEKIIPFLESLNYEPAKLWDGQGYKDDKNLTFWYKWQLYKRLESSLYSFYKSIRNLRDRFYVYKVSLEKEKAISKDSLSMAPDISGTRFEKVMDKDRLKVVTETFQLIGQEKKEKIIQNVEEDLKQTEKRLRSLEEELGEIDENPYPEDKKLEMLKNTLRSNLHQDKPTIVFSEFRDTINYLFRSLEQEFEKIDYIHGETDKSKDKLIRKFQEGKTDIILTTDVLSEGVNIPRADSIINYDLPYNPVKLVQRAGRALRITNPKKLFVHNFKPEEDIDKELELYDKLDLRLKTILKTVGLDFVVWMMDEKKVEELHEEEMEEYMENYSEYKEKLANTNPDDLITPTVPEESKLDRAIRRAINKFNISRDFLENVSKTSKKPFYTVLKGKPGLYFITKVGNKFKNVNKVRESLEPVSDAEKLNISDSERLQIRGKLEQVEQDIVRERTSRRDLSRNIEKIIQELRECRNKFEHVDNRQVISNIEENLANETYQPDELEEIETAIKEINDYPNFVKHLDDKVQERDFWSSLENLAEKSPSERKIELKAFIKYINGE